MTGAWFPSARRVLFLALCLILVAGLAGCGGRAHPTARKDNYDGHLVKQYGGTKTRPDPVSTREIVMSYPKTGEQLDLAYFANGSYNEKALAQIRSLMRDRHTGAAGPIDPELIDFMVDIRTRLGLPPTVVFEILSGYRAPETNAALRATNGQVAKESLHMYGYAVDFRIKGVSGAAIAEIAKTMQRGGVSYYPSDNHVHVDIGNIRTWATH